MKFAILLPVFNNLDYTRTTLMKLSAHLGEAGPHMLYMVLIDDGSTDGTSQWVSSQYPEVHILKGDGNLWWSGAINMGAAYALDQLKADYLVLWNNDIEFQEDYFTNLVRITEEQDGETVVGSKIFVAGTADVVWSAGGHYNPKTGKIYMYGNFKKDRDEYRQVREVDWLTGMGTIVPAAVVRQIGYWDNTNFPQYHGDSDFTYRAKRNGFRIILHPALVLYNHTESSGINHEGSWKGIMKLMTDIRSKSNLKKNIAFLKRHATSPLAYLPLFWFYAKIFGGFFKWKLLTFFGFSKKMTG